MYAEHELPGGAVEIEFYDLTQDPYQLESQDENPRYDNVIEDLKDRLEDLSDCMGSSCWITSDEEEPTDDDSGSGGGPSGGGGGEDENDNRDDENDDEDLDSEVGDNNFNIPPVALILTRNLYQGTSGNDVARLQEFLTQTGDFTYGEITGYYGPVTRAAVERYQCRNGIVCHGDAWSTGYGVVGPKTRQHLATGTGISREAMIAHLLELVAELQKKLDELLRNSS